MMEESKKAAELIQGELNKAKQYSDNARRDFLTFTNQYLKEDGSLDFDKIAADNRMNDYNALARFSEGADFEYAMVKDYIRSNSTVAFSEVEPMGFDFATVAQRHDEITKDSRIQNPSQSKVEVKRVIGNTAYSYTKNVGEILTSEQEVNNYKTQLNEEISKVTNTKLDSPAFIGVREEACTAIVNKINKEQLEQILQGFPQQDKTQKSSPFPFEGDKMSEEEQKRVNDSLRELQAETPKKYNDGVFDNYMHRGTAEVGGIVGVNNIEDPLKNVITPEYSKDLIMGLTEKQADSMVEEMAQGVDVLGENQNQQEVSNGKQMGFTAIWLLGLVTGIVSAGILVLGAVLLK